VTARRPSTGRPFRAAAATSSRFRHSPRPLSKSFGAVVVIVAVLTSACGVGAPSAESSADSSPSVTETATSSSSSQPSGDQPSAQASAAPRQFPARRLAVVRVNDLNVRVGPSVSAPRVLDGEVPITLDAGAIVLILDGPVEADDVWWFAIAYEEDPSLYARPLTVAWVAGGTGADPWLDERPADLCPTSPTFADLVAMSGMSRLGCYGATPLRIEAYQAAMSPDAGLGGVCEVQPPVPQWLACDGINYNWVNEDGATEWSFLLHFDPARGVAPTGLAAVGSTGPALTVTGHFDDVAAADCVTDGDPGSTAAMSQWLTCAARFVVDTLEVAT